MVTVREFMSAPLIILDYERSVAEVCELMGKKHIGCILVSRNGIIDGIFTERDLTSKVLRERNDLSKVTVGSYASSPLITVTPTMDVKEAARVMTEMRVRRLVVVEDSKPVGLFTASDLARAVGKFPLEI